MSLWELGMLEGGLGAAEAVESTNLLLASEVN